VDGTTIPEVDFDVGPSWSGLIPISGAANETTKVRLFELGNVIDGLEF
jgi:carboxypeptidase D